MREGAPRFVAESGVPVPAVTAEQMREVDRVAVEEFGLGLLQMMENAGRNLAEQVVAMLDGTRGAVAVVAGPGGNGGGGLCAARHLHNRGLPVSVILDREAEEVAGPARTQLHILEAAGVRPVEPASDAPAVLRASALVIDALIGYGLHGVPRDRTAALIDLCNAHARRVLALDVPSGLDATTGATPGVAVRADRTLTLALPKTGLGRLRGDLYLADIGIPPEVYGRLGLAYAIPFRDHSWTRLVADQSPVPHEVHR